MLILFTWVVLVMFLKLKDFGGTLFRLEESVPLSMVRVEPYLVAQTNSIKLNLNNPFQNYFAMEHI